MLLPPDLEALGLPPYQAGTSASPNEGNKTRIEETVGKASSQPLPSPFLFPVLTRNYLCELYWSNSAL